MVQFGGKIRSNEYPNKVYDTDDVTLIQIDYNEKEKLTDLGKIFRPENRSQESQNEEMEEVENKRLIKNQQKNNPPFLDSNTFHLAIDNKLKNDIIKIEREHKSFQVKKESKSKLDQKFVTNSNTKKMANLSSNRTIFSKKFIEDSSNCETPFIYNKRMILFKTEMCRSFTEAGVCKYGDNCQFCHDPKELRIVQRHPKYKTEGCKTFWTEGSCPYGNRCCFVHGEDPEFKNIKRFSKLIGNKLIDDETEELNFDLNNEIDLNNIIRNDDVSSNRARPNRDCHYSELNNLHSDHIQKDLIFKEQPSNLSSKSGNLIESDNRFTDEKIEFFLVLENENPQIQDEFDEFSKENGKNYLQISTFINSFEENLESFQYTDSERFEMLMGHSFECFLEAQSLEKPELQIYKENKFSLNTLNECLVDQYFKQNSLNEYEIENDLLKFKKDSPWCEESIYFIPEMKISRLNKM